MKFLSLFFLLTSQNLLADTISFRADNWCPFNCAPGSATPGYVIEMLNATLGKAGHKVDYQILAWNRALLETAEGKYNGVIGASKDDLAGGINSEPIGLSKSCFFVKKESAFAYSGLASINGKKVGIIKEYKYDKDIDEDIVKRPAGYEVGFGEDPLTLNIRKLDAGRIDIVLENETVFNYTANVEKMGAKFKSAGCVPEESLYVSFSGKNPKNSEYAKIFNDGVAGLRKSGELKKILDKYSAKDWK